MKNLLTTLFFVAFVAALSAQSSFPRLFVDIPVIAVGTPNVEKIQNLMGANAETAFNLGTHWSVARLGLGIGMTLDPKSNELKESIITTPYALFEVGAGLYRTNGDKCAAHHQNAFTAMPKVGVRYHFNTKLYDTDLEEANPLDFTLGAELGYFFLRDVFKNTEFFLDGNYYTKAKVVSARFGFKLFLNVRADMSRRY